MNKRDKRSLFSNSTYLLKCVYGFKDRSLVCHVDIYKLCKRATPEMICNYYTANTLHSILKNKSPVSIFESLELSLVQNEITGSTHFPDKSSKKIDLNCLQNRVKYISKKVPRNWCQMTSSIFKKKSKLLFLKVWMFFPMFYDYCSYTQIFNCLALAFIKQDWISLYLYSSMFSQFVNLLL